ncbi:copper homeostasis membrane protein CopD [Herbaspirillum huttiense]|uniref:copper homeostasis membrane protein CopD n=1 Tax=Herbaspirillum huttiense TaxID=863372 RepID=UPI0039AF6E4B
MNTAPIAWIACRFLQDAALLNLWGMSAFMAWRVPATLRMGLWARLRGLRKILRVTAAVAVVASLPVQASVIVGGWDHAMSLQVMADMLRATSAGRAWTIQLAALLVLLLARLLPAPYPVHATALASGVMLGCLALTGHAVMHDGLIGRVHQLNDVAHVLAAGAWLGALPVVVLLLSDISAPFPDAAVRQALSRFSAAGHVAVLCVIVSGASNVWLVLGRVPSDAHDRYQAMLMGKIGLTAAMVLAAVINRYGLVPAARRSDLAARYLRRLTLAEIVLAAGIIALVAVLGIAAPD